MRFSSTSLLALGFAWSVASMSMALAQSEQTDRNAAERHTDTHIAGPAPRAVIHAAPAQAHYDQQHRTAVQTHQQARGPQRWNNGGHYGGSRVVFSNWGLYQLQQPTYGYEWVQDGDELVLIEIDTGIISNVFIIPG